MATTSLQLEAHARPLFVRLPAGWGPDSAPEDCGRLQQLLLEAASCGLGRTPDDIRSLLACTFAARQRPGLITPAAQAAHRILSCALSLLSMLSMLGLSFVDSFEGGGPSLIWRPELNHSLLAWLPGSCRKELGLVHWVPACPGEPPTSRGCWAPTHKGQAVFGALPELSGGGGGGSCAA